MAWGVRMDEPLSGSYKYDRRSSSATQRQSLSLTLENFKLVVI